MNEFEQKSANALEALRQAVAKALDTKRRLGHYAIMYENGTVLRVPPECLPKLES